MTHVIELTASIIIPCFNGAEFLAQAIESALAQTYRYTEITVVDDGSTDESAEIAAKYPVKLVRQANKGLAGARNAGVLNSCGDVILPLDCDDWIEPTYLEKTIPLMTPGVGIVTTDWDMFGVENRSVSTPEDVSLSTIKLGNHLPVCSLIRRSAFMQTGGYNHKASDAYADWELWIALLKRGWRVAVVSEILFHYRRTACSMVNETTGRHQEYFSKVKALHLDLYAEMSV